MQSLYDIRKKCGLTTEKMAKLLDIPEKLYENYERFPQHIPYSAAKKFSNITGISLDDIDFCKQNFLN